MTAAGSPKREIVAWWLAFVVASALLVAAQWSVPYLPTNDGPQHVLIGHIQNNYVPGSIYVAQLVPNLKVTYYGFDALFMPLEAALGWQDALRLSLSIITLLFAWGFVALARSLDPRSVPWVGLLGFPLALSWHLYGGFFAYLAASGLGLWIVAWGRSARSVVGRAALGLALFVQAIAHIFAFMLTFGVLLLAVTTTSGEGDGARWERRWRAVWPLLLLGVPELALGGATFLGTFEKTNFVQDFSWLGPLELAHQLPTLMFPGPSWRAWLSFGLLVVAACAVFRAKRWRSLTTQRRTFAVLGAAFLMLALVAPFNLPTWQFFSPRMLPLGLALLLAGLGPFSLRAGCGLALAVAVWLSVSIAFHRDLAQRYGDAIAGLFAPVQWKGVVMPVPLEATAGLPTDPNRSPLPYIAPLTHWPALYAAAHGGFEPYLFVGGTAVHAFGPRRPAGVEVPLFDPAYLFSITNQAEFAWDQRLRRRLQAEVASLAVRYEAVAVMGARPSDRELWRDWGFRADWQQGSVLFTRFAGCRIALRVTDMPDDAGLSRLEVAIDPAPPALGFDLALAARRSVDQALELAHLPCGHVSLEPYVDLDRSGKPSSRDRFCREAGPDGRFHVTIPVADEPFELTCHFAERQQAR